MAAAKKDAVSVFEEMQEQQHEHFDDPDMLQWFHEQGIAPPAKGARMADAQFDVYVDSVMERGRDVLGEYLRNREVYKYRKIQLDEWYASVQRPLERRLQWVDGLVRALANMMKFPKGKKSRRLPNGDVGKRLRPMHVDIVDNAGAVLFSKRNGIPLKEEPMKRPLAQLAKARPEVIEEMQKNGIVIVGEADELFWRTPEHAQLKGKGNAGEGDGAGAEGDDAAE
jgi:hypothetical protein